MLGPFIQNTSGRLSPSAWVRSLVQYWSQGVMEVVILALGCSLVKASMCCSMATFWLASQKEKVSSPAISPSDEPESLPPQAARVRATAVVTPPARAARRVMLRIMNSFVLRECRCKPRAHGERRWLRVK